MSVSTRFVETAQGQWVTLCEMMEGRQALIIQCLVGPLIVGVNTAGPNVTTVFGVVPAGILQTVDTAFGVPTFRLSLTIDGDLVKQQWSGWVPVIAPLADTLIQFWFGSAPQTLDQIGVITNPGVVIIAAATFGPAALAPTCTSSAVGVIAPFTTQNLPDGLGDTGILCLFIYDSPGGGDACTIGIPDPIANANAGGVTGPGIVPDIGGAATGGGPTMTLAGSGPVANVGELLFAAVLSYALSWVNAFTAGWASSFCMGPQASNDGTGWSLDIAFSRSIALVAPTVTATFSDAAAVAVGEIWAITVAPVTVAGPVVTVIESFETHADGRKEDEPTFSVELPRLSAEGVKSLMTLLDRAQIGNQADHEQNLPGEDI